MSFQSLTPEVLAQLTAALPESVLTADQISEDYAHDEMVCTRITSPSFPAEPEPGSAADVRPSAAVWSLIRLR